MDLLLTSPRSVRVFFSGYKKDKIHSESLWNDWGPVLWKGMQQISKFNIEAHEAL